MAATVTVALKKTSVASKSSLSISALEDWTVAFLGERVMLLAMNVVHSGKQDEVE